MFTTLLDDWLHRPTTIYECAHCGTTVDSAHDSCPYCEHARIAVFEV